VGRAALVRARQRRAGGGARRRFPLPPAACTRQPASLLSLLYKWLDQGRKSANVGLRKEKGGALPSELFLGRAQRL